MTTIARPQLKTPPGPQTNFFVGNLRDLQRSSLRFYISLRREYGDIVRFRAIGPVYAYMFFHPKDIEYILRINNQNYHKGIAHQRFKSMLGESLLTSDGNFWLRQRRLAQPAFHRQRIAALAPIMTGFTENLLERWHTYEKSGQAFDVSTEMMRLTFQIVAQALFNTNVESEADKVGAALTVALDYINRTLSHFTLPESIPTLRNRRYHQALHVLDKVVYDIIEKRRQHEQDTGDLLSMFMLARDEETGERMSDEQLHNEVITLLLAGHETTANTLTWTWYLLSQNPDIAHNLHDELASVLGGRAPIFADLAKLPYTKMIIDETLRLYPPAWGLSRRSVDDDEIGGYHIPGNTEVAVCQYITHRHPDFWEQPEEFNPERFTPECNASRPHFAYFPFGGGPRLCIGNNFALMEAQLVLATIAQVYELGLVPHYPVIPEPLVTLRPRHGMLMTLHTRRTE